MQGFTTDNIVGSAHCYAMKIQHSMVHRSSNDNQMKESFRLFLSAILKEEYIEAFLNQVDESFKEAVNFIWKSITPKKAPWAKKEKKQFPRCSNEDDVWLTYNLQP